MNRVAFYGSLWTGDYTIAADLLRSWLKTVDLDVKIRLSGEEIVYEDEELYLYCYSAASSQVGEPSFLLEGHTARSLDEARSMLQALSKLCRDQDIEGDFEYVAVNENGDEVSEQFQLE